MCCIDKKTKLGDIDLFDSTDKELVRFGHITINKHISDIVAPEMMRRLKVSTDSLNKSIKEFDKSSKRSSDIMILLTIILIILTLLLSWQTFMQFLRG